jgi:hypothetical protein
MEDLPAATTTFHLSNKKRSGNSAKVGTVASGRPFAPCPIIQVPLFEPIASRERSCQIDVPATPIKVSYKLCAIYSVKLTVTHIEAFEAQLVRS